jgi:hypothetical protein
MRTSIAFATLWLFFVSTAQAQDAELPAIEPAYTAEVEAILASGKVRAGMRAGTRRTLRGNAPRGGAYRCDDR